MNLLHTLKNNIDTWKYASLDHLIFRPQAWLALLCPTIHTRWVFLLYVDEFSLHILYVFCLEFEELCMCELSFSPEASSDSVHKDPGLSTDYASGSCLQEIHRATDHREVQPRQSCTRLNVYLTMVKERDLDWTVLFICMFLLCSKGARCRKAWT